MILMMGATGTIGRDMVRMLTGMGIPVRVMTRELARARALPGFERAEVVFGDSARQNVLNFALPTIRPAACSTSSPDVSCAPRHATSPCPPLTRTGTDVHATLLR